MLRLQGSADLQQNNCSCLGSAADSPAFKQQGLIITKTKYGMAQGNRTGARRYVRQA